jgi:hypothetical protein
MRESGLRDTPINSSLVKIEHLQHPQKDSLAEMHSSGVPRSVDLRRLRVQLLRGCLNIARTNLPGPSPRRAGGQLVAIACKACGRRCLARSSGEQFVADLGTLREPGVTRLLERRDVDEHVLPAAIGLDKSISLGWIKPLHRPHRHVGTSS